MSAHGFGAPPSDGPVLRDIHMPPSPPWWPPAPGWWALALLVIGLLAIAIVLWRRKHRARQWRARILAELDALAARHATDADGSALAAGLHQLLRRVALRRDPAAAQARGEAWRRLLAQAPVDTETLDRLLGLEQAIYRPQAYDTAVAVAAARRWLIAALRAPAGGT